MRTHSDACRWPGATLIPYLLCLICLNPEPRDRYSDPATESTGDQGGDNLIFRYICPNTRCGEQQASAQYYARATRLSWPPRKTVDCATMQQNSNSFARPHHITHNCPSTRCGELAFGASKTTRWCEHGSKYRARGDVMETMIILYRSNPQLMCLFVTPLMCSLQATTQGPLENEMYSSSRSLSTGTWEEKQSEHLLYHTTTTSEGGQRLCWK